MRIAGVGTLISSGLVFGYLGSRSATAYASPLPYPCSHFVPGGISTDDSFNLAVAAVNNDSCNVIDISHGFTFTTAPSPISSVHDDSLTIAGPIADDSVLNGGHGVGLLIDDSTGVELSVSGLTFTNFDDTPGPHQSALSVLSTNDDISILLNGVSFSHNYSGGGGGAVYVKAGTDASSVYINGDSYFGHNTSALGGGAVFVSGRGTVYVSDSTFANNVSLGTGGGEGGGAIQASVAHVSDSQFVHNEAARAGGALADDTVTTLNVFFQDDSASFGGAIQGSWVTIGASTHFDSNEASNKGGAIDGSVYVKASDATFTGNHAQNGGAIYTSSAYVTTLHTVFSNNHATFGNGGAIRTMTGAVWSMDDSFNVNTASNAGGAIFGWLIPVHADSSYFSGNMASSGGAIASQAHSGQTLLEDCTFDGNYASDAGGAVSINAHNLHATGTTFTENAAHDRGGAINVDDTFTTFTALDDTFADNHSLTSNGGAAYVSGNLTVGRSLFADDTAHLRGGAIYTSWESALVSIESSVFTNSSSGQYGGAIATKGDAHVYDSTFSLNDAVGLGGAIYTRGATAVGDDTFVSNTAGTRGGAVYAHGGLDDTASTWEANHSGDRGGGVGSHGPVTLQSSDFTGNFSANGGAVYSLGELQVTDAYFADDTASATGGAIFSQGPAYISYTTFTGNEAASGGAIFNYDDTTTLTNATAVGNSATVVGGAFATMTGPLYAKFSTIVANEAAFGSAIHTQGLYAPAVTFTGSVLAGESGPLCDNTLPAPAPWPNHHPLDATATSSYSFATDFSCTGGTPSTDPLSINTTFSTMSSLGFDDTTLTIDDSTGQQVLIPNPTSVLVNAVSSPVAVAEGVAYDQLLASRAARSDDPFTTIGAVQVRDLAVIGPSNTTVSPGATAIFSVDAQPGVGTSLDYQWEQSTNAGASWSTMPGETTDTLTLPGVNGAYNGRQYRVLVADIRDDAVTSSSATLTVSSNPGPAPSTAPSAPRDARAVAGDAEATVTWDAPADPGSYPVTTYQVRNDIDGTICLLTVAPGTPLACTLTGLTNGRAYQFSVRALNGAGWSPWSDWTTPVTPQPTTPTVSITIVGSRDHREATVIGTTTGLAGRLVRPMVKIAGQASYTPGKTRIVNDDGRFTWSRVTAKKVFVYFTHGDTTSNRVVIPALRRP